MANRKIYWPTEWIYAFVKRWCRYKKQKWKIVKLLGQVNGPRTCFRKDGVNIIIMSGE